MINFIIQAGGRGSRLRHRVWNMPKCIVSVKNKPLIYHLMDLYPEAKFHIIGDYKYDVLETYLKTNSPKSNYTLYKTTGKGTCCGIKNVLNSINENEKVVVTWGDILYLKRHNFDYKDPVIFKTSCYDSRYKFNSDDKIVKQKTSKDGVAGIFYFPNKSHMPLENITTDQQGSFLNWCIDNVSGYVSREITSIQELGDYDNYESIIKESSNCRFFNELEFTDTTVHKRCIDKEYDFLIKNEQYWYDYVSKKGFNQIPKVISKSPYVIEKISGKHIYDLKQEHMSTAIQNVIDSLRALHRLEKKSVDTLELFSVYVTKTKQRLEKILNLIPYANQKYITINGIKCRNIFYQNSLSGIDDIYKELNTDKFSLIHGDPSLSNIIVDKDLRPHFIDPRGYFYEKKLYGDANYDFAKVYFSAVSGYDFYNKKDFILYMDDDTVEVIMPNHLNEIRAEKIFEDNFQKKELRKIKFINALIWFGMSSYAIDDLNSIYAAHFLGLYYLEKIHRNTNE